MVSDCALTLFVPSTSPSLTGWPEPGGGDGCNWLQKVKRHGGWLEKVERRRCEYHPPWQLLRWEFGWNDVLLPLALTGPSDDLMDAILRRRPGDFWMLRCRLYLILAEKD